MIDVKDLLCELTTENIFDILSDIGHTDEPRRNRHGYMFRTTLCHNGENYNLQYFEETKDFYCFSECRRKHSIFDLVVKNRNCSFRESVEYVAKSISFDIHKYKSKRVSECWSFLQQYKHNRILPACELLENKTYPEITLKQFNLSPVKKWHKEGLSCKSQKEFEVGYYIQDERIVVPHRQWDTGELIGVMGRTIRKDYKENNIAKWYPVFDFNKNLNLYGFWQNREAIFRKKEIILMESEKSPIKGHSLGINNICATSGKSISPAQMKILIKLGFDVVIGYDKDVDISQVYKEAEKLKYYVKVSIMDSRKCDLLDNKDAPIDKGIEIFNQIYENRIVIPY